MTEQNESAASLDLTVNGVLQTITVPDGVASLQAVLVALNHNPSLVVVEHNGLITPRHQWQEPLVKNGDRLEIVTIVGGGS